MGTDQAVSTSQDIARSCSSAARAPRRPPGRRSATANWCTPPGRRSIRVQPLAGREVYHAGAFICGNLAWAVVGGREAGKRAAKPLSALAARDLPVLADDLVIWDSHQAFCGPRIIDLRQLAPGATAPVTPVRDASRWRFYLPLPAPFPSRGYTSLAQVHAAFRLYLVPLPRGAGRPTLRPADPAPCSPPRRRPTGPGWPRAWT